MRFDEYRNLDGVALAKLVADGEVTAAELLELAIARAEAVNPALNGLIIPLYDQAREQAAGALSGPLAGVPTNRAPDCVGAVVSRSRWHASMSCPVGQRSSST